MAPIYKDKESVTPRVYTKEEYLKKQQEEKMKPK